MNEIVDSTAMCRRWSSSPISDKNQQSSKKVRISFPEHRVREAIAASATLNVSATEAVNLMASIGLSVYSSTTLAALCGADSDSEQSLADMAGGAR